MFRLLIVHDNWSASVSLMSAVTESGLYGAVARPRSDFVATDAFGNLPVCRRLEIRGLRNC